MLIAVFSRSLPRVVGLLSFLAVAAIGLTLLLDSGVLGSTIVQKPQLIFKPISNNSPPPLIVTMTSLGYMAPRSKETWYFPEVYGIIAKTGQCLSMRFNSLQYLHL